MIINGGSIFYAGDSIPSPSDLEVTSLKIAHFIEVSENIFIIVILYKNKGIPH